MSASALKLFFNVIDIWKIRSRDARLLLGGIANSPYNEMKNNPEGHLLNADRLQRISYLVGTFKALNIIHGQELADQWVQLPNSNRIFNGSTPLDYMIKGGLPAMQTVRRLLDARRGGI
jgi:hypothetical protein